MNTYVLKKMYTKQWTVFFSNIDYDGITTLLLDYPFILFKREVRIKEFYECVATNNILTQEDLDNFMSPEIQAIYNYGKKN